MPRFRAADLRVDTKPDASVVSDADHAAEEAIRARIARDRPGDDALVLAVGSVLESLLSASVAAPTLADH